MAEKEAGGVYIYIYIEVSVCVCVCGSWSSQIPQGLNQVPGSAASDQVPCFGGIETWLAVVSRKERLGGFRRCRVVPGKRCCRKGLVVSGKSGVVPGKATCGRLCGWFSAGCWFQERLSGFRKGTKSVCGRVRSWEGLIRCLGRLPRVRYLVLVAP